MAIPFLNHINLSNNEVQNVRLHNTASITVSSGLGHLYFDTDDGLAKYYRANNDWVTIDPITDASFSGTTLTLTRVQTNLTVDLAGLLPTNIVETVTTTDGTYINLTPNSAAEGDVTITADLSAVDGTAGAGERYLTKNNTWATVASIPGTYDWDISDGTNSETIASGDTVIFSGGTYLTTSYAAGTNTLQIEHDTTSRGNSNATSTPGYGGTFTAVDNIVTNATGHVTGVNKLTVTLPSADNTTYDLAVAAGGSNDAAIELTGSDSTTDTVTVQGTSTTVKVTESGNTITLDLQDNVTIGNNLIVSGNLTVDGSTTTVESTVTTFTDPIIELNRVADGGTQADPTSSSGIQVNRAGAPDGSSLDVQLVWMEDTDDWEFQAYNHESTPVRKRYKIPTSFKTTIGGATSVDVDHYLGTRDVIVQLYDTSSYETVYADVTRTNEQTVTIDFTTAPGAGDVTVLIISAQGEQ